MKIPNASCDSMAGRQAYLDWLRILSIAGVLFFHAAMPFVPEWEWHIKNHETSRGLLEFNFWLSRFRMPLLFFISGTVSYYMLQQKSGMQFIGLRLKRLLLPLLFGMLVLVPPQVYMERINQGYGGSYLDFYPTIFTSGPYPKGNMSWHHLWFIAYLFVFDVLCTPFFNWILKGRGQRFLLKLNFLSRGKWIYLITLPSILLFSALYIKYPETNDLVNDWGRFFYWLLFLVTGFLCIANPLWMQSLQANRRNSLSLAVISFIVIAWFRWNEAEPWQLPGNWKESAWTYGYLGLWGLTAWMWMFAAVGYGRQYLNRKHRALAYINQAVYPFYILHQTVIVLIVYHVVKWEEAVFPKYLFTVVLSFFLSITIYHLLIRPYRITRLLFGMKSLKQSGGKE